MRYYLKCRLYTVKSDKFYMQHIIGAISKIDTYIKGVNFEQFQDNSLIHDAVIRQLEIIGEASKNLSEDLIKKQTFIPWKEIAGMRDKLIHQYFGVDFELVWKTLKTDIPTLQKFIQDYISFP